MKYLAALVFALLLVGCDATPPTDVAPAGGPSAAGPSAAPPELLPRPFTAEQIRDEWVPGLTLVMHTRTPDGETWERWTVVSADADGAEIEFAQIDAEGNATGEPRLGRSSWIELRNHANYPAAAATREEVTRDTALGSLEGWLYKVGDAASGNQTEVFFANSYPGAPLEMRAVKDGTMVLELAQVERQRPESGTGAEAEPEAP